MRFRRTVPYAAAFRMLFAPLPALPLTFAAAAAFAVTLCRLSAQKMFLLPGTDAHRCSRQDI